MAIIKSCDRCGKQMLPPTLNKVDPVLGDPVMEITLRVEQKPWDQSVRSPLVAKVGDYCSDCAAMALGVFATFSQWAGQ